MPVTTRKTGPMSWEFNLTTKAAPETVYDYLADFTKHPEWAGTLGSLTQTSQGPAAVGTTYRTEELLRGTAKGPRGITYCEITAFERPRRIAWEAHTEETRGLMAARSQWAFVIEPEDSGSRVRQQVTFVPPTNAVFLKVFGFIADNLMGGIGASPKMNAKNLERLQQTLDSKAT